MKNASTDFSSSAARIATTTTSWSRLKGFEGNLSASKLNETIHRGRRDTPPFERNIRRAIILRHERNDFDKIRRRQNRLLIVHKRFPIFRKKKKKKSRDTSVYRNPREKFIRTFCFIASSKSRIFPRRKFLHFRIELKMLEGARSQI